MVSGAEISATLLAWYDTHGRVLPWRISPQDGCSGRRADPYAVWLSEVMLQQTTVAAVRPYFQRFMARWPRVADLAAAADEDVMSEWAGLGYYARARNLLKCARSVVADCGGRFPDTEAALRALPGIGAYTAAAVAAIAFGRPAVVIDGNVERVVARLFAVETPMPGARRVLADLAARLAPQERPGDHAQAMMDLGATICTPRNPACSECPLGAVCKGRERGVQAGLPLKQEKPPKPTRFGIAYVARRHDGALLLERRPDKGLLGGTLGWPGTGWEAELAAEDPPCRAEWRAAVVDVRHTFTHFHLQLSVRVAEVAPATQPERGTFVDRADFQRDDLPTVMRKVHDAALASLESV